MPDLVLVPVHRLLRRMRGIEWLACAVAAWPGVVAADDEMRTAVVAPDDRVQEDLARAGHPHRQRQQAQDDRAGLIVVVHQRAVTADAREVIDVAGLGYAHDRMDQQTAADLLCRSLGQFLVGAVHRVAGLERDDPGPTQVLEVRPQLGRRPPQLDEVVMGGRAHHFQPAGGVVARLPLEVGDRRVLGVGRAIGATRLGRLVVSVDLLDVEEGQQVAVDVAQSQRLALGHARRRASPGGRSARARGCRRPAASRRPPARSRRG